MFTLNYNLKSSELCGNAFVLAKIEKDSNEKITFTADTDFSCLIIEGKHYRAKNGSVALSAEEIKDGIIYPKFVTGSTVVFASPFLKRGNTVALPAVSWEQAGAIYDAFITLEGIIKEYREELISIKEAVQGRRLFSFHENEN